MLYPLKFKDIYKEKVWGGKRLATVLGKDLSPLEDCGEDWVLSGLPGSESEVVNGFLAGNTIAELAEVYMDDLMGEELFDAFGDEFPLLLKFIDANDYLSVQVHPGDELARERGLKRGKTELWYVMHAEPGAQLISGFNQPVDEAAYLRHLNNGTLKEILNFEEVKNGDVLFMPPGRVHALGPGMLIAEVQQSADVTYRIYDWNRPDKDGKQRELHTDLALAAIDFSPPSVARINYKPLLDQVVNLSSNEHFTCGILHLTKTFQKELEYMDACLIYLCVGGQAHFTWDEGSVEVKAGEVVLIPAVLENITIRPHPSASFLEIIP